MLKSILSFLKKILGSNLTEKLRPLGHGLKGYLAAVYFGFPAKKLKLIGITGTKGKTTTTVFTGKLLNAAGIKTGFISSSLINDGKDQTLNKYHMGTIDGFWLQKTLKDMVNNDCKVAVLEMTSIGLLQKRHWGLGKFVVVCILNMYPEHLKAHGGWLNYKKCKAILFKNLAKNGVFVGHTDSKVIDNLDKSKSETQDDIVDFMWESVPKKFQPTIKKIILKKDQDYKVLDANDSPEKFLSFGENKYFTQLVSEVEISNLAVAKTLAEVFVKDSKVDFKNIISNLQGVPGRMEFVLKYGEITFKPQESRSLTYKSDFLNLQEYQDLNFLSPLKQNLSILVDYAHEPQSMLKLLQTLDSWKKDGFYDQIIHVVSCDGAGRDDWKKHILGKASFDWADFCVLTTDNYDSMDNPEEILDLLSKDLPKEKFNQKYFREINRRKALKKCLQLAKQIQTNSQIGSQKNSEFKDKINPSLKILLVSTGVGTEAFLTQPNFKLNWDERQIWLEEFLTVYGK